MPRIFLSPPDVGELESRYVLDAVKSGWVAPAGPDLAAFENEMCGRVGAPYAVALSSGTASLHLGLLALGVVTGDVVLTSTMTFAATANAVVYTGATPFFVDSDRETGNVDVGLLAQAAYEVRRSGRRLGAIVPVDLLGKCADLTAISDLAASLEVPLLVDAAESVGATHRGRSSGAFGAASVFSFNGNKIMTTGGGGMLLSHSEDLVAQVRYLATQARQPVAHYEHTDIGYNYRLSNLLAALGRAQLSRLDQILARRREIREAYLELFEGIPGVEVFTGGDDSEDNCWLTSIVVSDGLGWSTGDLITYLEMRDIECRPMWKPMHLQPVFAGAESIINGSAEFLFTHGVTLPSGSNMTDSAVERVRAAVTDFLATR